MNKIFKYKKFNQDKYFKSIRFLSKRYYSIEELKGNGTIAIRREDKNRWERRAPLAPKHVEELTKKGIKVLIQPSNLRIFSDDQYKKSGAIITEDISPAPVILGVKEVPLNKLVPNRTYCFFSHTIKAQKKNMPLLDSILEKNIRLIDYEKIVHEGQRLVKFGEFAGYAGMIDFLHGLGDRMLTMGYSTPFLHIGFTHMYSSMQAAKDAVREIGEQIAQQGLPDMFLPMIFVFTGTGSVSTGAREIFELLPHEWISKEQMHEMFAKKSWRKDVLYGTIASSDQIVDHNDPDKEFNKYEYYREPQNYHSIFAQDYGRYASAIINCMYWDHNYPRILTTEQIEDLHLRRKLRLLGVADLSCDLEGSIEVLKTTSSIDHPFFVYDVGSRQIQWDVSKKGIMFLAVDNLPTEIPRDATIYFGDALLPFIEPLALSDGSKKFDEQTDIPSPIRSSIVTSHGELTPSFKYIQDLRKKTQTKDKDYKKVIVLGSGMVSGPVIDFFANDPAAGYKIIIATNEPDKAEKMKAGRQNISVIEWDANDTNMLKNVISDGDVVISLLPAFMHVSVANICIEKGVSLVTTSYTTKEMQNLDQLAQNAQVTILNEMGLDPGLDHLEAMRVINEAKEMGGEVVSFVSWCGGLPAPEASGNPLAYKFSWSPRGALVAGTNGAVYKQGDRVIELAPGTVFQNKQKVNFFPGFNLEGYLNRDSLSYIKQYGLSNPKTFFRGTLRYEGFCDVLDALAKIGYLNTAATDKFQSGMTWRELTTSLVPGASTLDVEDSILTYLNLNETGLEEKAARVDKAFNWLGLFSDALVPQAPSILDALCAQMINKMSYDEGERDLIILVHHFIIKYKNGTESHLSSSLVAYGDNQYSAMARTVGYPAAIAAKLIMNGHIIRRGVVKPLTPDIYVPMLSHLKNIGIKFKHSTF